MFKLLIAAGSIAGCAPIVTTGTHTDPAPCVVWVTAGQPTGNVNPPCTLNLVGLPSSECPSYGGTVRPWGCENVDY